MSTAFEKFRTEYKGGGEGSHFFAEDIWNAALRHAAEICKSRARKEQRLMSSVIRLASEADAEAILQEIER